MSKKMKNYLRTVAATLIVIMGLGTMPQEVRATEQIKVMVNGEYVAFDTQPILDNGSVYVPMRAIFEALGYEVKWNKEFEIVESALMEDNYLISMTLYSGNQMNVKYAEHITEYKVSPSRVDYRFDEDCSVQFINKTTFSPGYKNVDGRILVPVRAISEGSGASVKWDGANKTVIVDSTNIVITNIETGESYDVNNAKSRVEKYFNNNGGNNVVTNVDEVDKASLEYRMPRGLATLEEHQAEVLRLINIERVNAGVPPLEADPLLMEIAQLKADEMEELNYFSHTSPAYGSVKEFVEHYGYEGKVGENILKGGYVPSTSVGMLMLSESHKANILNPNYKYLGVGRSGSMNDGIDVQLFSY